MSKIITLTDPITGESVYPITSAETVISSSGSTVESALGKLDEDKQDKITDLEEIRSKANSAVQSEDLANVAFSGSYNDLSNKPTIPDAITEGDVTNWGFTKNTGTITEIKMNGSSKGTSGSVNLGNIVTGVKINGTEKTPASGVVDLGTVITSHQDISGKLDKTEASSTYLTKTDASNTYLGKTAKAVSAGTADSATKATQDGSGNVITTTYATKTDLEGKVSKDGNKQLSEEDFTSALKQKLEGLNNYDDTEISDAINQLREDFDDLVDGDSSAAIKTFNEIIAFLEGIEDSEDLSSIISAIEQQIADKQDKIDDLEDIRTNAEKGKTSVQKVKINGTEKTPNINGVVDLGTVITDVSNKVDKTSLADVAISGSYNDLTDKPEIVIPDIPNNILGSVDVDEFIDDSSLGEYATKGYVDETLKEYATKEDIDKALEEHTTPEAELVVYIKQDGDNAELSNVKAKVTYGNKQVELSSGAKVLVPVGEDVTVEFPKLEGYKRPDTIKFTMSENSNTVNAVYKGALVTLNVSTYDGQSADGQVVTVQKTVTIDCTPDYDRIDELGVAIMDIYGKFYRDADEWIAAGRPVPNGVAVSDGTHRFCIAMQNINNFDGIKNSMLNGEGGYPMPIFTEIGQQQNWGVPLLPVEDFEEIDPEIFTPAIDGISEDLFIRNAGVVNKPELEEILGLVMAFKKIVPLHLALLANSIGYDVSMQCAFHTFPNSSQGYLASCGEWILASTFSKNIDSLFNSIGGKPLGFLGFDQLPLYWTDTLYGSGYVCACLASDGYIFSETTGEMKKVPAGSVYPAGQSAGLSLRPFCTLEPKHQTITTSERLVVKNGKVIFHTPYEAMNTVTLNYKDGYNIPERLEFQASGANTLVDMEYGEYVEPELPSYEGIPVSEAEDGVYAVLSNGNVIDYTLVNRPHAIGVALVLNGSGIMLADYDGDDGESSGFRWVDPGVNLDIADYTTANGMEDGCNRLPSDISDWPTSDEDVMNDFNGKENTEIILSDSAITIYDMAYLLSNFNAGNTYGNNHGFDDWYIPSLGELALLYMYEDEFENAYDYIGGGLFMSHDKYWSSSEYNANYAWSVYLGNDLIIERINKSDRCNVRFVRKLV